MTIKIMFERSGQKGGRQGGRTEGQQGTQLENFYCRPKAKDKKKKIWRKSHFCIVVTVFPRKYSDNNFGQIPLLHPPGGRIRGP